MSGRPDPAPTPQFRHVLVYDGECGVCDRIARRLRAWDRHGRLEIVASEQSEVPGRFPWIPTAAFGDSIQLIAPDGTTWQGAAAMERVIDLMPKGRLLTWVFSLPLARPVAERIYRWFARNRHRLGCGDHCGARRR